MLQFLYSIPWRFEQEMDPNMFSRSSQFFSRWLQLYKIVDYITKFKPGNLLIWKYVHLLNFPFTIFLLVFPIIYIHAQIYTSKISIYPYPTPLPWSKTYQQYLNSIIIERFCASMLHSVLFLIWCMYISLKNLNLNMTTKDMSIKCLTLYL